MNTIVDVEKGLNEFRELVKNDGEKLPQKIHDLLRDSKDHQGLIVSEALEALPRIFEDGWTGVPRVMILTLLDEAPQYHDEILTPVFKMLPDMFEENPAETLSILNALQVKRLKRHDEVVSITLKIIPDMFEKDANQARHMVNGLLNCSPGFNDVIVSVVSDMLPDMLEKNAKEARVVERMLVEKMYDDFESIVNTSLFERAMKMGVGAQLFTNTLARAAFNEAVDLNKGKPESMDNSCIDTGRYVVSKQSNESERHTVMIEDPDNKGTVIVLAGCFNGTVAEFKSAIEETHSDENSNDRKHYDRVHAAAVKFQKRLQMA